MHPTLTDIQEAHEKLRAYSRETPVIEWPSESVGERFGHKRDVVVKLECLQYTGSFKARAAILATLALDEEGRKRGVTAVSAGNHAAATAWAAKQVGSSAKVVMPRTANPFRVELSKRLGAEIVLVDDVHEAFAEVERIRDEEGREFIHPFEGRRVAMGTATVSLEFFKQAGPLDALIVPIGGGGLISGMALAAKLLNPGCLVVGVEPEGADTMHRSFASGKPESIDSIQTVADSLGAPHAAPYSFELTRANVDELVKVKDRDLFAMMRHCLTDLKLALEPAGVASAAALAGPLRNSTAPQLAGRVGVIACGANIDPLSFARYIEQ